MPVSITYNNDDAADFGVSKDKSYEALGFTDGNVIILTDNGQFLPVPFGLIGEDADWSIASDKPVRKKTADADAKS